MPESRPESRSESRTSPAAAFDEVTAGFIPLVDCAPLVMARELGLDRRFGIDLRLRREASWANIRDKIDAGLLDCAHMLAPMPIAAALGLGRATAPVIAPMALSLNGNTITASMALYDEMRAADEAAARAGGMLAARALAAVVQRRRDAGRAPLTLGMVYPFSSHNYDLRYWLASRGVDPDRDVNLVVVPPPLIAGSLAAGEVDGFCAGAPWGSVSVAGGQGVIVAVKGELWSASPEKVLGTREDWASENPELLARLICAVTLSARWLDEPRNRREAARVLARPEYVGAPEEALARPLTGELPRGGGEPARSDPDFVVFHRFAANYPWRSHALWFMTQMIRWGHARTPFDLDAMARRVYRPDIYRAAVAELGVIAPEDDSKPEGEGRFFGDETFDPRAPLAYLARLSIRAPGADLSAFAALNG